MTLSLKVLYWVGLTIMLWMMWWMVTYGASKDQMITTVRAVAQDYREKENFQGKCSIDWTPVSLSALVYSKMIQEWWWANWTVWAKTNNRWSLHKARWLFPINGTTKADGSKSRPKYRTPEEGLYEMVDLLVKSKMYNGCNIWYKQLYAYIAWPNRSPSATHPAWRIGKKQVTAKAWVSYKLGQLKSNAEIFDQNKDKISDKPISQKVKKDTWFDIITSEQKCKVIDTTLADRIQVDLEDWTKYNVIVNPTQWQVIRASKCWWVK